MYCIYFILYFSTSLCILYTYILTSLFLFKIRVLWRPKMCSISFGSKEWCGSLLMTFYRR